jgi:hypothetical protein
MLISNSSRRPTNAAIILCLFIFASVSLTAKPVEQNFLQPAKPWRGVKNPLPRKGNYFVPTGFTFEAVLEGAIFSYNLLTPVSAMADENIRYQDEIVFPKGTKFIGVVQVVHSLDRVNVDFHTCVFPDGEEIKVKFLALWRDGSAGVKGKVETHKDAVAAKVAMKSVLAGVQAGAAVAAPTVEGAMVSGLSQEAVATLDTSSAKTLESISVEERTPIKIFVKERTEF